MKPTNQPRLIFPLNYLSELGRQLPATARELRTVSPVAALLLFAAGFVCAYVSIIAAVAIAAGFAGIYIACKPITCDTRIISTSIVEPEISTAPTGPQLADILAAGLTVREIKLGQPAATNRKGKP